MSLISNVKKLLIFINNEQISPAPFQVVLLEAFRILFISSVYSNELRNLEILKLSSAAKICSIYMYRPPGKFITEFILENKQVLHTVRNILDTHFLGVLLKMHLGNKVKTE